MPFAPRLIIRCGVALIVAPWLYAVGDGLPACFFDTSEMNPVACVGFLTIGGWLFEYFPPLWAPEDLPNPWPGVLILAFALGLGWELVDGGVGRLRKRYSSRRRNSTSGPSETATS
jgi:hypothetical protein